MDVSTPPLISTSVCGPLGLLHLPRLWLKILLHSCGRLPEGYRHGVGGFDELLCTTIGLDRDAFVAYVETDLPTYLDLESWVRDHATQLNAQTIETFNQAVLGRDLPDQMREQRCAELGIANGSLTKAIALNDLDDWAAFHRSMTR